MSTRHVVAGACALLTTLACKATDTLPDPLRTNVGAPDEHLSSLDVEITYEPNGAGCVALTASGELPPLTTPGDFCPPGPGTPADPLPYQTGRKVRVFVNLHAIGSRSTYDFPVTGNIALSLTAGQIFSGTPTRLQDGSVVGQRVLFQNSPGRVQVWAEASTLLRLNDAGLEPTYTLGSSTPMHFRGPTVEDVQRTDNDAISVLDGQRVTLTGQNLVVTRIAGNGFTLQDLGAPLEGGLPKWDGLFVFAFNGVDNLRVGARLLKLRGAITQFQGMTQLAEPEYITAGASCAPRQTSSLYGLEPQETEEGGLAIKARCPETAECVDNVCVPKGEAVREYDGFGRILCRTANTCSDGQTSECPSGMACLDRRDWQSTDADGQPTFTCQACPVPITSDYWITPGRTPGFCGPIYKPGEPDTFAPQRLRNEALEGVLVELKDVTVDGLDLTDDFFRSGFESFGQWKVKFPDNACATVVADTFPDYPVVEKSTAKQKLRSFVGTVRQVRFNSGSAFWMVDLRHRGDLVEAPSP